MRELRLDGWMDRWIDARGGEAKKGERGALVMSCERMRARGCAARRPMMMKYREHKSAGPWEACSLLSISRCVVTYLERVRGAGLNCILHIGRLYIGEGTVSRQASGV